MCSLTPDGHAPLLLSICPVPLASSITLGGHNATVKGMQWIWGRPACAYISSLPEPPPLCTTTPIRTHPLKRAPPLTRNARGDGELDQGTPRRITARSPGVDHDPALPGTPQEAWAPLALSQSGLCPTQWAALLLVELLGIRCSVCYRKGLLFLVILKSVIYESHWRQS